MSKSSTLKKIWRFLEAENLNLKSNFQTLYCQEGASRETTMVRQQWVHNSIAIQFLLTHFYFMPQDIFGYYYVKYFLSSAHTFAIKYPQVSSSTNSIPQLKYYMHDWWNWWPKTDTWVSVFTFLIYSCFVVSGGCFVHYVNSFCLEFHRKLLFQAFCNKASSVWILSIEEGQEMIRKHA